MMVMRGDRMSKGLFGWGRRGDMVILRCYVGTARRRKAGHGSISLGFHWVGYAEFRDVGVMD